MRHLLSFIIALCALISSLPVAAQNAPAEKRIALVIGNAGYQTGALNTPANDAGLIAQTLQAAGFDVAGARDLDQDSLRRALRDFLDKAEGAGPDTVAFIYLSGYGAQLEGDNYFVPIDAKIARDSGVAAEAVRISDYTRPLAALKLKASIVVLDAARANPFAKSGPPLAGGLALVEPEPGMLIAFNAAPGTVAPEAQGAYGPYAQALAEMMREGGLPLAEVFDRVRLRVNDMTKGAQVPWHASKVQAPFVFFERAPDAPPPAISIEQTAAIRARPIRDFGAQEAYVAALERDTLQGYSDFLATYPNDPMAKRVRAIVAARREAITWRRTRLVDTPDAYWSYLRRYPNGAHAADARRRLAFLTAAFEPPPSFAVIEYDVPPPPPDEIIYVERPVLIFDDPVFAFAPPPPPPVIFLSPPPPEFIILAPPPPPVAVFVLPMPVYTPVPVWVRAPVYVAPPPNNVIFNNIHNTVVINNTTNTVTITNRAGQTTTLSPPPQPAGPAARLPPGAPVPAAIVGPALPPSVAQKAIMIQSQPPQGPGARPGAPAQPLIQQPGQPLPGVRGQPLPPTQGVPLTGTPQQQRRQLIEQQRQQQIQQRQQQIQQRQQQIEQQRQQRQQAIPPQQRQPPPPPQQRQPPPPQQRQPPPPPQQRQQPPPPQQRQPPPPPQQRQQQQPQQRQPPPPPQQRQQQQQQPPQQRQPPPPPQQRQPPPPQQRQPPPPPQQRQPPGRPSCGAPGQPPCPR
jgi:uncharacterized caspase-like protein